VLRAARWFKKFSLTLPSFAPRPSRHITTHERTLALLDLPVDSVVSNVARSEVSRWPRFAHATTTMWSIASNVGRVGTVVGPRVAIRKAQTVVATAMCVPRASAGTPGGEASGRIARFAHGVASRVNPIAASGAKRVPRVTIPDAGARRGAAARAAEGGGGGGSGNAGSGSGGTGGNGGSGGSGGSGGNSGNGVWGMYLRSLESNPLATKCFTSGILNSFGDLFAQFMFENAAEKGCDWRRTGVFTLLGAFLVGPALHFWYGSLNKIVAVMGVTGTASATASLALDQLVFAPAFLAVFIASLFTIEGNAAAVVPKLKQDWVQTVQTNWKIWVPFQFLNFRFVPVNLQVGAANIIALMWNTYMSWVTHLEVVPVVEEKGKGKI